MINPHSAMRQFLPSLAALLLAACATPQYTYYFDKHDYCAGAKERQKQEIPASWELPALTASVAKETQPAAALNHSTPATTVTTNEGLKQVPSSTSRKELRQSLKQSIRGYQQVVKQQRMAEQPAERNGKVSGMAVAGFVAALVAPISVYLFIPLAIMAIIFSSIGLGQTRRNPELRGRGLAIAGLVIGILEMSLLLIVVLAIAAIFAGSGWS